MPLHHILLEAMKIAAVAEAYEVNCAPHNFYGHMSALMSAHSARRFRTSEDFQNTAKSRRHDCTAASFLPCSI